MEKQRNIPVRRKAQLGVSGGVIRRIKFFTRLVTQLFADKVVVLDGIHFGPDHVGVLRAVGWGVEPGADRLDGVGVRRGFGEGVGLASLLPSILEIMDEWFAARVLHIAVSAEVPCHVEERMRVSSLHPTRRGIV